MTASHYAPDTLKRADVWRERALCRPEALIAEGVDGDLWFADKGDKKARDDAVAICWRCPVRIECREDTLAREGRSGPKFRHGIRAGLTESQRHSEYRRRAKAAKQGQAA
ncbi:MULTISPECIES: WhiB family transcriptional regulator [Streptomyces]|uniref:WhiB family transcriptional regulator n=1 Tax=Streptomyces TaxID=1883 RepID=UPI00345C45B8